LRRVHQHRCRAVGYQAAREDIVADIRDIVCVIKKAAVANKPAVAVFNIPRVEERGDCGLSLVGPEALVVDGVRIQQPAVRPFTLVFVYLCYQGIDHGLLRCGKKSLP